MMTNRQLGWRKLCLILTVLPCCCSLQVSIPEREYIVERGGEISLTCSFTPARPTFNALILTWEVFPDNPVDPMKTVATYYLNNPTDIAPAYEGRVSLDVALENKVSTLRLTKVTMQDSRRYQCSVIIPKDVDGTLAATTFLLVTVPPSAPICKLQGTAEYWHNISLTCMSEEGSPAPKYKWDSYSVANIYRDFPPKTTEKDGVLSLFNISQETSGYYICTSRNDIGSASCNFTLAVMPTSMNMGSTAIIIIAVLAGLLVVGILIFCFCRRKSKKNKFAEGSPGEMEFRDTDAPETGKQYWDDQSINETKQHSQSEDKDVPSNDCILTTAGHEDDQQSSIGAKERPDEKGSDIESHHYKDNHYLGSHDQRDRYRGSREHLDDHQGRHGGSRDRLDDQGERYGGDRLDNRRDRYGGSQDRLDDRQDRYGGSRDRLDDRRDRYGGSRDRLDDRQDRYGGSRDRLDDRRDRYGGSRDRLDDQRDRYGGSRDRLDDPPKRYGGSRDRLDYVDN